MKTIFSSNGMLFGLLTWFLLMPTLASAAGFQINLVNTNLSLHLKATTVPAGRLVWFQGNQPDLVTNIVQIEGIPVVQHDFTLTGGNSAAFYRAVMLDTNYEREPIASGTAADAAVTTKGTIEIWGGNFEGTFGNGTSPYTVTNIGTSVACWSSGTTIETMDNGPGPVLQSSANDWVSIAEGRAHTLALKADGTLWGWGDDTYGELGNTNGGSYSNPVQIGSSQQWSAIFVYAYSSFAIRSDGTLWAWGNNGNSVLGLGPAYTNSSETLSVANSVWVPTQVGSASNWVKVVTFPGRFSVGIQSDGSLWAWGNTELPSYVRAGFANTNVVIPIVSAPAPVGISGPWVDVTTHPTRGGIVALKADGSLWVTPLPGPNSDYGWANYLSFVQTQEQTPGSLYNVLVGAGLSPADALIYVVDYLWFVNNSAEAGFNFDFASFLQTYSDANLLQPYSVRNGWLMVRGVNALNRDGTIWILGGTAYGGPKDYDWQQLNADSDWAFISYGSVAAKTDGSVWNWDALANGSVNYASDMVQLVTTQKWLSAKKTTSDVIALDTHSNLWVWGENDVGQLGLGDNISRLIPTQLSLAGPWMDYAATPSATYAIRQDGELWVWGNFNDTGTNIATPVRLNPERAWRAVYAYSAGGSFGKTYVLSQDGTLWAFGDNAAPLGVLGTGDTNDTVITNLQQLAGTNWAYVSPGNDHALALKTDGTFWGWGGDTNFGLNAYEFGLGYFTNTIFALPTALPGVPGQTWTSVNISDGDGGDGFGITSGGVLWAWGEENFWSQLGIVSLDTLYNTDSWDCSSGNMSPGSLVFFGGNETEIFSPMQVSSTNKWKTVLNSGSQFGGVDVGGYTTQAPDLTVREYTLGLEANGTLWIWGKSPFASVVNQQVYLTPPSHPFPNTPYPQYPYAIPIPQQVGTNTWSYIGAETAVTTKGDLYMWGFNQAGQLLQPATWETLPVNGNIICRLPPPTP